MIKATAVALALLFGATVAVQGQAASLNPTGRWITEYYRTASSHGQEAAPELARARLTLGVRGDSVVGQWEDLVSEGQPLPKPRGLFGVLRDGRVVLTADPVQATMRQHIGADVHLTMITTYDLVVRGDSLVGTQRMRSSDGKIDNKPRPFTAVREPR